jgi:hypothetical protein
MAWVKLDDRFPQHPKILQISSQAFRLYITGLCYASLYQTDGKLLSTCISLLAETFHEPSLEETHPPEWIEELVRVGLWEKVDKGYQIHDYLEYNLSKENREELAKTKAESGRLGGLARAKHVAGMLLEQRRSSRLAGARASSLAKVKQRSSHTQTQTQTQTPSEKNIEKEDVLLLHSPESTGPDTWPSPQMLVKIYNALAPSHLPRVSTLNPQREKRAKSLLKVYPDQSWWEDVFSIEYPQSRFLMGKVKGNGHGNFLPHFDWIIGKDEKGQDNCVKVHDGNYRDPAPEKPAGPILSKPVVEAVPCSPEVAQENLKRLKGLLGNTL